MTRNSLRWIIITGEYPPQSGGVSDYSREVALALVASGDTVQVWAPLVVEATPAIEDPGVTVHQLPDRFGLRGLPALHRALTNQPTDARLLVQYVPHAFGWKAMNVPFCLWLWTKRKRHNIIVMFHEVATPWKEPGQPWRLQLLALTTRIMACLATKAAKRVCVSIPAWEKMLRPFASGKTVEWLPVPSTMPTQVDTTRVAQLRKRLLDSAEKRLIGHFGTFGDHIAQVLRLIVPRILVHEKQAVLLLVGRNSIEFATELSCEHPDLTNRIIGAGALSAEDVAEHLSLCEMLIQPYADGVSSRRTSVMASLALGLPVVTNHGFLTEPIWAQSNAVRLADSPEGLVEQAIDLLADERELARLRVAAAAFYKANFSIDKIIAQLRVATFVA